MPQRDEELFPYGKWGKALLLALVLISIGIFVTCYGMIS